MFGKKSRGESASKDSADSAQPAGDPRVFAALDRMEKAGVQLLVRFGRSEIFTSTLLGLGRDAFFIDTLSPPSGDQLAVRGSTVDIETLINGITYRFTAKVMGKVEFLDDLPAFKLAYPASVSEEHRRKSRRIRTRGTASISFLEPFNCDAPVVDISEGGFAFEYGAEMGRLRNGTRLNGVLLELGIRGVVKVDADVVVSVVSGLGGLSLPKTYRTGVRLVGLSGADRAKLKSYLEELQILPA